MAVTRDIASGTPLHSSFASGNAGDTWRLRQGYHTLTQQTDVSADNCLITNYPGEQPIIVCAATGPRLRITGDGATLFGLFLWQGANCPNNAGETEFMAPGTNMVACNLTNFYGDPAQTHAIKCYVHADDVTFTGNFWHEIGRPGWEGTAPCRPLAHAIYIGNGAQNFTSNDEHAANILGGYFLHSFGGDVGPHTVNRARIWNSYVCTASTSGVSITFNKCAFAWTRGNDPTPAQSTVVASVQAQYPLRAPNGREGGGNLIFNDCAAFANATAEGAALPAGILSGVAQSNTLAQNAQFANPANNNFGILNPAVADHVEEEVEPVGVPTAPANVNVTVPGGAAQPLYAEATWTHPGTGPTVAAFIVRMAKDTGFTQQYQTKSHGVSQALPMPLLFPTAGTWYVQVAAYNSAGISAWQPVAPFAINIFGPPVVGQPPAAPSNLQTISVTQNPPSGAYVGVTWQDNSNNENAFQIQQAVDPNFTVFATFTSAAAGGTLGYCLVTGSARWYFRVRAYNVQNGVSAWSNVAFRDVQIDPVRGLALPAAAQTHPDLPPGAKWSQAANFYDAIAIGGRWFAPGSPPYTGAALDTSLERVAELGIRHVRSWLSPSWTDPRWNDFNRMLWIRIRQRNDALPAPAGTDKGHPMFATIGPPVWTGAQSIQYTTRDWWDAFDITRGGAAPAGRTHWNGFDNASIPLGTPIPNGTTVGADTNGPNPWSFTDSEYSPRILGGLIQGPNEPDRITGSTLAYNQLKPWGQSLVTETRKLTYLVCSQHSYVTASGITPGPMRASQCPVDAPSVSGPIWQHIGDMSKGTNSADTGDWHPYRGGGPPTVEDLQRGHDVDMPSFSGQMASPPDRSKHLDMVWTEFGYVSDRPDETGPNQGDYTYVPQDLLGDMLWRQIFIGYFKLTPGVRRFCIWELSDVEDGSGNPGALEAYFGLCTYANVRKDSFYATRNCMELIGFREATPTNRKPLRYSIAGNFVGIGEQPLTRVGGGVWGTYTDRFDSGQIQTDDNEYIIIGWRQFLTWNRGAAINGGNAAAGRVAEPANQNLVLDFDDPVDEVVIAYPTHVDQDNRAGDGVVDPDDGRTWSSPLALTNGDTRCVIPYTMWTVFIKVTPDATAIPNETGVTLVVDTDLVAIPDDVDPVEDAPAAPSNCNGGNPVFNGYDAVWTDNSDDEDGFEVQRALDPQFVASVATTTAAADDEDLAITVPHTGLWYTRVRAFNSAGVSAWSTDTTPVNVTTGTPPGGTPIPWIRRRKITMGRFFA